MKTRNRSQNRSEDHSERGGETAEAIEFHSKRMRREEKIEVKRTSSTKPEGNYEYEQSIAEEAGFNAKPMIERAAYLIAEGRAFAPGHEVSDWLAAEAEVEGLLRGAR